MRGMARALGVGGPRPFRGRSPVRRAMATSRRSTDQPSGDPLGIIISRGSREEPTPAAWAYVWGPAPATTAPTDEDLKVA